MKREKYCKKCGDWAEHLGKYSEMCKFCAEKGYMNKNTKNKEKGLRNHFLAKVGVRNYKSYLKILEE